MIAGSRRAAQRCMIARRVSASSSANRPASIGSCSNARATRCRSPHWARSSQRVEQALDDGRLNEAQRELSRFDNALRGNDAPEALRARAQAARARLAQLRGWQHWAGSQARDELVLQAEALAAATLGADGAASGTGGGRGVQSRGSSESNESNESGESGGSRDTHDIRDSGDSGDTQDTQDIRDSGDSGDKGNSDHTGEVRESGDSRQPGDSRAAGEPSDSGDPRDLDDSGGLPDPGASIQRPVSDAAAEVARLSLHQRADIIDTLRARWKEIDRHGQAGSQALWRRFDTALKTAYEPVAAQAAAQRAARQANLQARWQLLEALEARGGNHRGHADHRRNRCASRRTTLRSGRCTG